MKRRIIKYIIMVCVLVSLAVLKCTYLDKKEDEKKYIQTSYDVELVDNVKDCVDQTDIVVKGKIVRSIGSDIVPIISDEDFSKLDDEEKLFFEDVVTKYEFEISDVISGKCKDDSIVFTSIGGECDDMVQEITDEAVNDVPVIGDEYILMLRKNDDGTYSCFSIAQGMINVEQKKNKELVDTNDPVFDDCEDVEEVVELINEES